MSSTAAACREGAWRCAARRPGGLDGGGGWRAAGGWRIASRAGRARRPGSSTWSVPTGRWRRMLPALRPLRPRPHQGPMDAAPRGERVLALQDTAVPVPRVLGVHPVHQAMLSERAVGENWFSRLTDADEGEATAHDFMTKLAALHALDAASLDLPLFPAVETVADAVQAELDEWDRVLAARGGTVDPALAFSLVVAAPARARVRRSARPGAGRHRPGQLHVRRRAGDGGGGLGAGPPGRPDGRHRLAVVAGDPGALHRLPPAIARVRGAVGPPDRRGAGALLPGDGRDEAAGDEPPAGPGRRQG